VIARHQPRARRFTAAQPREDTRVTAAADADDFVVLVSGT
jgi:hypothetical protein